MRKRLAFVCSVALILMIVLGGHHAQAAVVVGQIDNFGTGAQNWANGQAAGTIALGGPAGTNDPFLDVLADGSGSKGKLTIFNRTQWLGNYLTAGVNEIDLDLKDFGTVPATLSIRLAFRQTTVNGAPGYLSTTPFTLTNDGLWHHAAFQITAAAMTAIGGPSAFATLMASPAEFRILNEAGLTNLDGDVVTSQLGIDNIQAVPEPNTLSLFAVALGAMIFYRFRKANDESPPGMELLMNRF